jgi:hypothetical protein
VSLLFAQLACGHLAGRSMQLAVILWAILIVVALVGYLIV